MINKELELINEKMDLLTSKNPKHVILGNSELADFLDVTTRTLQNWRNDGLITYSKIGSCIFYRLFDVLGFLDKHRVDAIDLTKNHLRAA